VPDWALSERGRQRLAILQTRAWAALVGTLLLCHLKQGSDKPHRGPAWVRRRQCVLLRSSDIEDS
jgi:hypothetical protein